MKRLALFQGTTSAKCWWSTPGRSCAEPSSTSVYQSDVKLSISFPPRMNVTYVNYTVKAKDKAKERWGFHFHQGWQA